MKVDLALEPFEMDLVGELLADSLSVFLFLRAGVVAEVDFFDAVFFPISFRVNLIVIIWIICCLYT